MTYIAIQRDSLYDWVEQGSVWVVLLGRECKRDIIFAFRQAKRIFILVVEQVKSSLAKIGILGSDVFSMVLYGISET